MLTSSSIKRETGLTLPSKARPMFARRYNMVLNKLQQNHERNKKKLIRLNRDSSEYKISIELDKRKAKNAALSFIKTRFKLQHNKWHERVNGRWIEL